MALLIGVLVGIVAYFLLAQQAKSIDLFVETANAATQSTSYDSFVYAGPGVTMQQEAPSNITFVQGAYIQPNNQIPTVRLPVGLDVSKLLKPTNVVVKLPQDYVSFPGQCVNYVKYELRNTAPDLSGNAKDWQQYINSKTPIIGSVAVMKLSRWGHVGIVVAKTDTTVTIRSRNYRGLWIISDDEFEITDISIAGYITF